MSHSSRRFAKVIPIALVLLAAFVIGCGGTDHKSTSSDVSTSVPIGSGGSVTGASSSGSGSGTTGGSTGEGVTSTQTTTTGSTTTTGTTGLG